MRYKMEDRAGAKKKERKKVRKGKNIRRNKEMKRKSWNKE